MSVCVWFLCSICLAPLVISDTSRRMLGLKTLSLRVPAVDGFELRLLIATSW